MKLIAGVISLQSNTTRNEIMRKETYLHMHLFYQNKVFDSRISRTTLETNFHFISPTIKSNVNRISFVAG